MSSAAGGPSLAGGGADSEKEPVEEEATSKPARIRKDVRPGSEIKRRKRKKEEVDMSSALGVWASSLKGPHLVSIAMILEFC